jgi:hypothetical protein
VVTAVDTIIITLTKDINNPHPSRTCKITRISSFLSNSFLICFKRCECIYVK